MTLWVMAFCVLSFTCNLCSLLCSYKDYTVGREAAGSFLEFLSRRQKSSLCTWFKEISMHAVLRSYSTLRVARRLCSIPVTLDLFSCLWGRLW